MKMRLLIFLVFSQNGLAGKYGIIFQINIYLDVELHFVIPDIKNANKARL